MSKGIQERNIMILFLSTFIFSRYNKDKLDKNGNKIFDAKGQPEQEKRQCLLPPGRYKMEALSAAGDDNPWVECIQTNEAPIKDVLLTLKGKPLDAIFCLVSDKVGGRMKESGDVTVWKSKNSDECETFTNEMKLFFEKRLPSINKDPKLKGILKKPLTADIFKEVEFHESADDPSAESIRVATVLEDAIKDYMTEENEKGTALSIKDCHIYADITGGKRTANMAISAALQLLQYDGAHLERVVYSDYDRDRPVKENEQKPVHPVSNVQPINDLYKLVAGVDAFKKYGSSGTLNEYFEDVKKDSKSLRKLLSAMNDFSESVLLCQTTTIKNNLKRLMNKLHEFEKGANAKHPEKVRLFVRMINDLQTVYSPMLPDRNGEPDEIEIIQWCIDNSLIQQALTLCTEWLPEYLINHGAAYTDSLEVQEQCLEMKNSDHNSNKKADPTGRKYYIMKFLGHAQKSKTELEMQPPYPQKATKMILRDIESRASLWQGNSSKNAVGCSRTQMKLGRLESDLSEEEALEFIRGYAYIRGDLRNKINHADKDATEMHLHDVRKEIDAYLMLLRRIRNHKHIPVGIWAEG